jgi:Ras-related GTP-binding protein A/B
VGLWRVRCWSIELHNQDKADSSSCRQDGFTESYLTNQRSSVFASVAVLIFVFDVESREFNADLINYASIVQALRENSPQAKIFVLIHKMDLIMSNMRDVVFAERSDAIRNISIEHGFGGDQQDAGKHVDFWGTSIWDQSLYKAWTQVIYYLVPNAGAIENLLRQLAEVIDAHELILYERTTCLMVTHVSRPYEADGNPHPDRFERLSSILKSHKHSVAKHTGMPAGSANFAELQIKTGEFMFLITRLSENTNLAVVMGSGEAMYNAARINIANARDKFAELDIASKSREKADTRATDDAARNGSFAH